MIEKLYQLAIMPQFKNYGENMNNFDQSSSGLNIELNTMYCIESARINFDENFKRDEYLEDHFHFVDYGNHNVIDLLDIENYKFTKKDIIDGLCSDSQCSLDYLKQVFLEDQGFSFSRATKSDLIEYVESTVYNTNNLVEFYIEHLNPRFEVLTVNGYSQGDVLNVIFSHEAIEEYTFDDKETFINKMCDYSQNLAFSCPVYACLEIDGNEVYLDHYLKDIFYWDKEQVLAGLSTDENFTSEYTKEQQTYILTWLDENLQTDLDYL